MYVTVNGIQLYYSVSGKGQPLILLHGNGETHHIFDLLQPQLSAHYTVISVDSRCHGKSEPSDIFNYDAMEQDIYEMIVQLKISKPIIFGFSDGAIVAMLLAMKHPRLLDKLVLCGPNTVPKGLKASVRFSFAVQYFFTRSPKLKLILDEPNITAAQLNTIVIPALIVVGEKDIIAQSHAKYIAASIPQGKFLMLPKENHYSYIVDSAKMSDILHQWQQDLLNGPLGDPLQIGDLEQSIASASNLQRENQSLQEQKVQPDQNNQPVLEQETEKTVKSENIIHL